MKTMVKTGLEKIAKSMPEALRHKKIGVLCHAPSITSDFIHITEIFHSVTGCNLAAIFGPQHGLFGQTQDNMIEWEGELHPIYKVPVYSLYGKVRKPTRAMLDIIDILVVDLQDVGARLYTYIWTVKHCMEACAEAGIPVWILDRPNPIARLAFDGPVLKEEYFTFVGGASIPLCHRMTIGEMAVWIREKHFEACDLTVVKMEGWRRNSNYSETGLPWVLPSPNLPSLSSTMVYPGTVLIEALNLSEGRGTTIPFQLFGAPWLNVPELIAELRRKGIGGCAFREHNYIPTFHKYAGKLCHGVHIHVTDELAFRPVETAFHIFDSIIETSPQGSLTFNEPPYEYEDVLKPFDILSGDDSMRITLQNRKSVSDEISKWRKDIETFRMEFDQLALYPE